MSQLYIVAAPSGAGKTSLVSALVKAVPDIQVSISHTTRAKRPNETEGTNYFFIDEPTFQNMRAQGDFLESATVFHYHYGTSKEWVLKTLNKNIDVILEIDWQGAQIIKKLIPAAIGIFIMPPSLAILEARLRGRQSDSPEVIAERLAEAAAEISHYAEFDYLVVNDDFNEALEALKAIVHAARHRTAVMERKLGRVGA